MKDGDSTWLEDLSGSDESSWEQQEVGGAGAVAGGAPTGRQVCPVPAGVTSSTIIHDQNETPHVLSAPPVTMQDGGEQLKRTRKTVATSKLGSELMPGLQQTDAPFFSR